jgi:hypothetical protein
METHIDSTIKPYRDIVVELLGKVFQVQEIKKETH